MAKASQTCLLSSALFHSCLKLKICPESVCFEKIHAFLSAPLWCWSLLSAHLQNHHHQPPATSHQKVTQPHNNITVVVTSVVKKTPFGEFCELSVQTRECARGAARPSILRSVSPCARAVVLVKDVVRRALDGPTMNRRECCDDCV